MWVDYDGMVLQQESYLNNSRLTFTRVKDSRAQEFQQASIDIRQRRLRDFDAEEFNPEIIPEDKVDLFAVGGTEIGKEDNTRYWNGRCIVVHHGPWRDGYHRRREGDIWDQVAPLAEPHRSVDPNDQIVDPFVLPDEQRSPSAPLSKDAAPKFSRRYRLSHD